MGIKVALLSPSSIEPSQAVSELKEAFASKAPIVRCVAAKQAGVLGRAGLVEDLEKLLSDEYYNVREYAALSLGALESKKSIPKLCEVKEDNLTLAAVTEALGMIGSPKALPHLRELIKHESYRVRKNAAEAIGKIGEKESQSELIKALTDDDYEVRVAAAKALGILGSKDALPALEKALEDYDWEVRETAAAAIENIRKK